MSWFMTYTGRHVNLVTPALEDIVLDDIAHALSNICRFGGHTAQHYSVAQHSVLVSTIVEPEHALAGLLHDAAEAYLGDVIAPLKGRLPGYLALEHMWVALIGKRFGLIDAERSADDIKRADRIALLTERRDLRGDVPLWSMGTWEVDGYGLAPLPERLVPLTPPAAEALFLSRFEELGGVR